MAASSRCSSCSRRSLHVAAAVTALFLLIASCSATRPGGVLVMREAGPRSPDGAVVGRKLDLTAFQYEGQAAVFNFLPKGVPIPPSGPSKRHNSLQN